MERLARVRQTDSLINFEAGPKATEREGQGQWKEESDMLNPTVASLKMLFHDEINCYSSFVINY